jgi:hypothetical protein
MRSALARDAPFPERLRKPFFFLRIFFKTLALGIVPTHGQPHTQ